MNKNKISVDLLSNVNVLSCEKFPIILSSNNFNETKQFLDTYKYSYKPYRFTHCFCLSADNDDLAILSDQTATRFIQTNKVVSAENFEQEFINIKSLTEDKYFGQDQTICFIDTGIHPHLDFIFPYSKILKFKDFINNISVPYDDNGHGTFVAGIACGNGIFAPNNKGFAPQSNLVVLKALDKNGSGSSNLILDAMQWVYENYKAYKISVVCMSFGASFSEPYDPLSIGAEALWKCGITVVAAAGNSGPKLNTIKSPGNNPNIITVGALDVKTLSVANFSSRGPTMHGHKPDLLAPAVDITSCNNTYLPYTKMSGTSVAAPIVASICSILKSKYPKMTNNEIKQFLLSHCTHLTGNYDEEGAGYLKF